MVQAPSTKTIVLSISFLVSFLLLASGFDGLAKMTSASHLLAADSTPTPSPTPTPIVIDISPQPLPTDVPEINLSDAADNFYGGPDVDCDGIRSSEDNCPFTYNPDQKDSDKNGIGDACDGANKGRIESHCDPDGDGIPSYKDNCPLVCNPKQEDKNKNGIGDVCDSALLSNWVRLNPCPKPVPNKNLSPSRAPAPTPPVIPEPQVNEAAILDPNGDFDCDGVPNRTDNCMWVYNPDQKDSNKDGIGDACIDPSKKDVRCDRDGDKVNELNDNCPYVCNPDQKDSNKNGIGDACEGKKGNSIKITPCPGRKTKHKLERGSFRKN